MNKISLVTAAALTGLVSVSELPAMAQQLYAPRALGQYAPVYSGVPDTPDEHGCVRMCERDDSPCDPPLFKHEDGRCNNVH